MFVGKARGLPLSEAPESFTIVIYDHNNNAIVIYNCNDIGQYYKTINYDPG